MMSKVSTVALPAWVEERLRSCPAAGQGVNKWLFSTARALSRFYSEAELIALLEEHSAGCGRVVSRREIAGQAHRGMLAANQKHQAFNPQPWCAPLPKIDFDPVALANIAAKGPNPKHWQHWLYEKSPCSPKGGLWFLTNLFQEGEVVLVFTAMESKEPALRVRIGGEPKELPPNILENPSGLGTWFLANPVDGEWHTTEDGGKSCRSKEAITAFRYAVLESDQACQDDWLSFLVQLPAPIAAIYTSGGRSIHALIKVDARSKDEWDDKVRPLKCQLKRLGADPNALTAVRLTRLPGCSRNEKGGFQELYYLNPEPPQATSIMELSEDGAREGGLAALSSSKATHASQTDRLRLFLEDASGIDSDGIPIESTLDEGEKLTERTSPSPDLGEITKANTEPRRITSADGDYQAAPKSWGIDIPSTTNASAVATRVDKDPLSPGPFPIEAMSKIPRRIAEEVARCHQVPVEMTLLAVLAVLAASVPRKFTLKGGANGQVSHGNLYVLISAPRSAGKSSIAHPIVFPLIERNKELLRHFREEAAPKWQAQLTVLQEQSKQALDWVRKPSKKDQFIDAHDAEETLRKLNPEIARLTAALKAEPHLWIGSHTSEKLSSLLPGNGEQCLIYATEGAEVFRVMAGKYSKDGKASYDIYLSGFSVEPMNVARVGSGSITITPCLSMLLFVQPIVLREVLDNQEAAERGLFARLIAAEILVKPQPDDGVVREIDPLAQSDWNELINRLLDERDKERTLVCTPEARKVFVDYYNLTCEWRNGECRENEADLGRAREIAIRIALNLALADSPDATEVTEDIARRAVAIGRWCLLTTYRLSNRTQAEILKDKIQQLKTLLEENSEGCLTVRDLRRNYGFQEAILDELVIRSGGMLEKWINETGGRPSPMIRLAQQAESL